MQLDVPLTTSIFAGRTAILVAKLVLRAVQGSDNELPDQRDPATRRSAPGARGLPAEVDDGAVLRMHGIDYANMGAGARRLAPQRSHAPPLRHRGGEGDSATWTPATTRGRAVTGRCGAMSWLNMTDRQGQRQRSGTPTRVNCPNDPGVRMLDGGCLANTCGPVSSGGKSSRSSSPRRTRDSRAGPETMWLRLLPPVVMGAGCWTRRPLAITATE